MLIFAMVIGILPQTAFAADNVAYVKNSDGTVTNYSGFAAAWNAAVELDDATVGLYTSYMHHAGESSYVLPEGKTITVELNGNMLLRNITKAENSAAFLE